MDSFCSNCGEKLNLGNKFCPKCGVPVSSKPGEIISEKTKTKSKKRNTAIFVLICLIAVIFAAIILDQLRRPKSPLISAPTPKPVEQTLADGIISVPAGKHYRYSFTLSKNAVLTGDYRAFGGSRNDIQVLLMDEDAYVNWINGHRVRVLFNSGQVTVGKIELSLTPAKYCLVFNNGFSVVSSKNVETHIKLTSM
jgi:hypothetical protein